MKMFRIGEKKVGPAEPAFVIAEVAQAHDGSLGMAHAYIDAVAGARADAVKFQTHIAEAESTRDEPFRIKFSRQDHSRYDYWRRMEFSAEQWRGLHDHAVSKGLIFLSSAFSLPAVRFLSELGIPAWKIGSGEFSSPDLLGAMISTGRPILFSTGMANWTEIDAVVARIQAGGIAFALLQCTSQYPTPIEHVGLNVIGDLRQRYSCPTGLSDHSGSTHAAVAAIARGADIVEVHVTFDRRMFGPDTPASLTFDELEQVVAFRDACGVMDANPVDKDAMADVLAEQRRIFTKSLAPVRPLSAGTVLSVDMLTAKKPGTGIPVAELERLVGRRLVRDVAPDRLLAWSDLATDARDA